GSASLGYCKDRCAGKNAPAALLIFYPFNAISNKQ
ncbi:MAG: hypothetical protein ACI8RT_001130, partial [Candidatus Azotimanducaceae bacterium]